METVLNQVFIECKESQIRTLKMVLGEILKHIDDVVKEIDSEKLNQKVSSGFDFLKEIKNLQKEKLNNELIYN